MAATQTEGMVAVVRGAGEAGVAVTLLNGNKQYTLTPTETSTQNSSHQRAINPRIPQTYQSNPVRNPPLLQAPFYPQQQPLYNYTCPYQYQGPGVPVASKVNAGMVTDQRKMVKCDSAVQACDGRYTSTYRRHHCHMAPTSPDPLPTEFPAQKPNLCPGTGHFVVGGSGSGATHQIAMRSTEYRGGPMIWPDRGAVCCPRPRNHPDAFVSSLRKYPRETMSPDRSSEIVERLINYTQTKNTTGKTHCHSTSRISNVEAFNLRKSLFSQNYAQSKNAYEEFRARSPVRGATGSSNVEEGFGNERRTRNDDRPYLGFNRNPDVRYKLNLSPNRRVPMPTQRNNKESNTNQATDSDMSFNGPTTSRNKRPMPTVLLDVVEEIETETVQTIQSTASYTDLTHNLADHTVRKTKSFEVILTDSAEKFRREILGCFQGISLIPSRDPKERILRQGLLKKLTRKLNKLCEIYKGRYNKQDKVPKIEGNHKYPAPCIPVVCDKNNFGATLRTIIEPSISVTKRQDTKVYLVEVPESSRAFNNFSSELNRTVAVWLDSIEMYGQRQERQEILEHFLTRLKMVFADRPSSHTEFREMLKAEIIYLLDCIPLSTETNRVMYKHRYAEVLLDKLLPPSSVEMGQSRYDDAQVHQRELKKIVSAELGCFLQDMRVEVYDRRYLEYVKKDLYEILCDALTDIYTDRTEEIHTDLVLFLQESLSVTEVLADEMAQSMITSIRNVKAKDKPLSKVKSNPLLTKTSGNFLVYLSRSQDKFGGQNDSIETVSVFEPSRDGSYNAQGNISQYQNDVSIQIDEWLNSLQIGNIPNRSQTVDELAADIVDRKRYLELNLSAKPPNNDIDYLKYQIFKWVNKSVGENNQQTIVNASGLMKRIQGIPVPDLQTTNQSIASSSRRNSSQQNESACRQCCSLKLGNKTDSNQADSNQAYSNQAYSNHADSNQGSSPDDDSIRIEDILLGWLTATPLYRNRIEELQDEQEQVIKKLAKSIGKYKKNSDLSRADVELSMVNMIIQHIKALPLDNGKHFCCMRSSIVEATARYLNECLEKLIYSANADNFSISDYFLRKTIEDWIRGLPFEPFKNAAEAQAFRARQEDFIQRLKSSRSACCSRKKIIADIESFLMSMPFDCGKKCDPRFLNSEIIKLLQMLEVVPLEDVDLGGGYDSFMSGLGPTSSKDDLRLGKSKLKMAETQSNKIIDNWVDSLPIPPESKRDVANKLKSAVAKALSDPNLRDNPEMLEKFLDQEIDRIFDSLQQTPQLRAQREQLKQKLKKDLRKAVEIAQAEQKLNDYSASRMRSLDDSLSMIFPSSQQQAMEELGLEHLVDDYVEKNYKGNNDIEKLAYKKALLDKIVKVLDDIARQGISMDVNTLKAKLLDAMKEVSISKEPPAEPPAEPNSSEISELFRKAADDLNIAVADWCDEIPWPAHLSPAEKEEAKMRAREAGNKLVAKINEALADPKMREDSFLFQSIAENEIDNMLDALPQSPELQARKDELKRNLMKKFNDAREKATGEYAVHDYGKKIDDIISNILPSQYDNPDIVAAKEKLAETFKELMFEPLSPSQKKKVLKRFNALVDEIYDATPCLNCQTKEQVRRRLLNALKKVPPPPKKFMANELAEFKLKREVSDFFHDLKVRPQSKEDKEHVNKIKSALAKVLHDTENRVPVDSEEYDRQMKDALNKWAHKLPLTSDQESQLPCLISKLVDKLKASHRKRRDDLAAHLNEDEDSASDEEEAVCWKCKQKIGCKRPPSVPCIKPTNFYIPPQCYMPLPDYYGPPPQPCFKPPDCYTPLPDCYKQPNYNKPFDNSKACEYSRPPEANRQLDSNKLREGFRQPDGGKPPIKRPNKGQTNKPGKFPNCRRTNSPMASMNPHHCFFTNPPFCPRCYALGHPCNEHRY